MAGSRRGPAEFSGRELGSRVSGAPGLKSEYRAEKRAGWRVNYSLGNSNQPPEVVQRLIEIKGVGRWTVEMFLIFNLGRLDVLPVHDPGVRKGFQIAYRKKKMPEPEQLERFGEKWRPYRTVAARYLWRAVDLL